MKDKIIKDLSRRLLSHQLRQSSEEYHQEVQHNLARLLSTLTYSTVASYAPKVFEVDPKVDADYIITSDLELAKEHRPDVILIPLHGYTRRMHRLGRSGSGFYDKLLAHFRPKHVIGVGTSAGESVFIPELHDIPLDYIVIENKIIHKGVDIYKSKTIY